MTILITGGAGFIGSHLADRLLEEGQEVVCLDNFDPYYDPEIKRKNVEHNLENDEFKLIEGDVRDQEVLREIFGKNDIEKVVHLASKVGVRSSLREPQAYERVNVGGTVSLLEVCKEYELDSFVYGSSSSVYGVTDKIPFSEDDPIYPISPYAATKRSAELLCHTYSHLHNIPTACLRFFTVYGPRQRPEMAIHKFTHLIDEGKEIKMYGDGTSKRDYTYIDDVLDGITSALNDNFDFEIFNLGNSKTIELGRLINVIEDKVGKKAKVNQVPDQPGDVPITYADISKAKKELGYNPRTDLESGIEKFVKWYKKFA